MSEQLTLRPPQLEDESQVREAQAELAREDFLFVFQKPDQSWAEYLKLVERQSAGVDLPPGRIPASMLMGVVGSRIVGRVHIRHQLTPELREVGGHIGYAVRPSFRRQGYATAMLHQALAVCRDLGITEVMLTCDDDNPGSITTIERCGGVLESDFTPSQGVPKRRYWIEGEGHL
ncbi:GNAT family N-acetyltransferase [Nesterenkonia sp. MY13]|uniref:GNAT family N-acetyltransferase n=1 Tax=Nesterenkonia sedimenti TaxID=1463632 RepID=A0A7X8THI8_9MICC|nr:GNAT family N-acetyltransferase [Nesterenkonia sedimenti]NLS08840.1 GNAT family N-acetyltransferase [Nesterenkonia sedimenti]